MLLSLAWGLSPLHLPLDGSNWMRMRLCQSCLSCGLCRDFKLSASRSMVQTWPRSGGARDLYNPTAAQRPLWAQLVHFCFWSCGPVPFSSLAPIGTSAWHASEEAEDAPRRWILLPELCVIGQRGALIPVHKPALGNDARRMCWPHSSSKRVTAQNYLIPGRRVTVGVFQQIKLICY